MLTPGYPEVISVIVDDVGHWNVYVTLPTSGGQLAETTDITIVRGIVTQIESIVFTDPFGPAMASLTFPGITMLDSLGEGDLEWWRPGANIDIVWTFNDSNLYATADDVARTSLRWEGYIAGDSVSFEDSGGTMTMTCKGALRRADNTLAMPQYPARPIPYEHAIRLGLVEANIRGAGLGPLRTTWPDWWDVVYKDDPNRVADMVPMYISAGDKWSGMITRNTGDRTPMLTGYIQGLLGSMHTPRGQFTLGLTRGRIPVLHHRDRVGPVPVCEIDLVTPGVKAELANDYEAKANVVYGTGRGLDGVSFSNMQFTGSVGNAYYLPFAAHHSVYPYGMANPSRDPRTITREISLQFYEGMNPAEAQTEANAYLRRYASSGAVGNVTLTTDPYTVRNNRRVTFLRHTLIAGDSIRLVGAHGRRAGVPLHIVESSYSPMTGTLQLTVDSQFRDQLTSSEVRLRGRDALTISRLLTVGSFSPTVRDQLLPWHVKSGYAPVDSTLIFDEARSTIGEQSQQFPWDDITRKYPPKDARYKNCYIHIPPADPGVLQNNWNRPTDKDQFPKQLIWLSQAGSIALMQFMAVDANGERMNVPFHLTIALDDGVNASAMPLLDKMQDPSLPPGNNWKHPLFGLDYGYYPFFPGAFENVMEDGTTPADLQERLPTEGVAPLVMLGGYGAAAGYYPGTQRTHTVPTGLVSVEQPFTYDVTSVDKDWDPQTKTNSFEGAKSVGIAAVLVYCDAMWDAATSALVPRNKDVYFIGRLFRVPSGAGE